MLVLATCLENWKFRKTSRRRDAGKNEQLRRNLVKLRMLMIVQSLSNFSISAQRALFQKRNPSGFFRVKWPFELSLSREFFDGIDRLKNNESLHRVIPTHSTLDYIRIYTGCFLPSRALPLNDRHQHHGPLNLQTRARTLHAPFN